jgi:uncharacterized protein
MAQTLSVKCPTCSAKVPWTEASRYRPFCSERCRTADLGDWAAERHRIDGGPVDDPAPSDPETGER